MKRPVIIVLSVVIIAACLVRIVTTRTRKRLTSNDWVHAGIVEVTTEQAALLLPKSGQVLFIRATNCYACLPIEIQNQIEASLKKKFGSVIHVDEEILDMPVVLPAGDYLRILQEHPAMDLVVSLAGPPSGSEQLPAKRPKYLTIGTVDAKSFEQGWIDVALLPRNRLKPFDKNHPPKTPRAWFEYEYQVVTPATVSQLSE